MHGDNVGRYRNRLTHLQRGHLMFARTLERPIFDKSIRERLAHNDGSMVAQHQYPFVTEMLDQPRALFLAHRDAFKVMIGQLPHEVAGVEVNRLQAALKAAHSHSCRGMRVDNRVRIGQSAMEQCLTFYYHRVH